MELNNTLYTRFKEGTKEKKLNPTQEHPKVGRRLFGCPNFNSYFKTTLNLRYFSFLLVLRMIAIKI